MCVSVKLSVIVPVYRVEATLGDCVRSILEQSFPDLQLILVDDGSPDRCPRLCDEWEGKDSRICVIHKDNGGLSSARNAGIEIAKGQYLMFVDSDDILANDTIRPLVEMMDGNPDMDMVEFSVRRTFVDGHEDSLNMLDCRYEDKGDYWLRANAYAHTYACNKIYRREMFSHVRFPEGKVFEDMWTLPELLKVAKVVGQTSNGCYIYRENRAGITVNASADDQRSLLEAHLRIIGSWLCPEVKSLAERRYYMHVVDIQTLMCEMTGEKPLLPSLKVGLSGLSVQHKIKALLINMFGLGALCSCNYYFRRFLPRNK